MNRCFVFRVLPLLVLLAVTTAGAQISISYSEMQDILANSERANYSGEYLIPLNFDLGTPSASVQTFDFTGLTPPDSVSSAVQEFISPAGQPGAASFPTATLCTPMIDTTSFEGGEFSIVMYYRLQTDGFYLLGMYSRIYMPGVIDQVNIEEYSPMRLVLPLPLNYGTSRTGVDTTIIDSVNNVYSVTETTLNVDGWGDITLPDLTAPAGAPKTMVVPCLRATETDITETYDAGTSISREKNVSVVYIAEDGSLFVVDQGDTSYAGGTAPLTGVTLSKRIGSATEVRQTSPLVPGGFSLSQNYPNPFNPSTVIAFSIPAAEHVTLTVYDILGREVATLVDRQMAPGSYEATFDAAGLPSGLYLYRIVSGSFVETRKMNVVK